MGCDFQLMGSQEDRVMQRDCLTFLREAQRLHDAARGRDPLEEGESVVFTEGDELLLSNATSFRITDPNLNSLVDSYVGVATFSKARFFGDDRFFMFDREHRGLICSTASWPESDEVLADESDRPYIGAGVRHRGPSLGSIPFEAVAYAVIKARFVPNLDVKDDYLSHAMHTWDKYDGCVEANLSLGWMANTPLEDLPQASLDFFTAHESNHEDDWTEPEPIGFEGDSSAPPLDDWRTLPLQDLEASVRLANSLSRSPYTHLCQLEGKTDQELIDEGVVRGRKTLRELKELAASHGLVL